jgi:hypothetical protein
MKTVTKRQAVRTFEALGDLAHGGQVVLVTDAGKPWIKLGPPVRRRVGKSAALFRARLNRLSAKPIPGVAEMLTRSRR